MGLKLRLLNKDLRNSQGNQLQTQILILSLPSLL